MKKITIYVSYNCYTPVDDKQNLLIFTFTSNEHFKKLVLLRQGLNGVDIDTEKVGYKEFGSKGKAYIQVCV